MKVSRALRVLDPSIGFDLLRMYLGIALFVRGMLFVADPGRVLQLAGDSGQWFGPMVLAHYVGMAHLGGGVLLALGLVTRLAAAVQVPVLVGAVFFVHWGEGLLRAGQSLELAGLVLVMLVVYAVFGGGPLSLDARLFRYGPAQEPEPEAEVDADSTQPLPAPWAAHARRVRS